VPGEIAYPASSSFADQAASWATSTSRR